MPTPATWDETDLCVQADIDREIGSRPPALAASVDSGRYAQLVIDAIALAKIEIGERLLVEAPSRFSGQATLDELDEVRDLLLNPSVLTRAATAFAICALYRQRANDYVQIYGREKPELTAGIEHWTKEAERRWTAGFRQLKVDLDDSGDASDAERVSQNTSLYRI